jgi:hypothetical protein
MATPKTFCAIVIDAPLVKSLGNQLQFSKIYLPNVHPVTSDGIYNGFFLASNLHNEFSNICDKRSAAKTSGDAEKLEDFQSSSRGVCAIEDFFQNLAINFFELYIHEQPVMFFLYVFSVDDESRKSNCGRNNGLSEFCEASNPVSSGFNGWAREGVH